MCVVMYIYILYTCDDIYIESCDSEAAPVERFSANLRLERLFTFVRRVGKGPGFLLTTDGSVIFCLNYVVVSQTKQCFRFHCLICFQCLIISGRRDFTVSITFLVNEPFAFFFFWHLFSAGMVPVH